MKMLLSNYFSRFIYNRYIKRENKQPTFFSSFFGVVLGFLFVQVAIRFCHMDPGAHLGRLIGFVFLAIAHIHWTHGLEMC